MEDGAAPERVPRPRPLRARVRERVTARGQATPFVPASETVVLDVRRSPVLLVGACLRGLVGMAAVVAGLPAPLLLALGALTAVWARTRLHAGPRRCLGAAAAGALAPVVLDALVGPAPAVLLLLLWSLDDVADWWTDRLVVSDRRIYRRYGVLTRHAPSIALTAIAFLDASVPPLGRLLGYGTLRLDSLAQRDAPLSRFDLLPDVVALSHEVLRLRAAAMPRFPQQPL